LWADYETPVRFFEKIDDESRSFFGVSAIHDPVGRYRFLESSPRVILKVAAEKIRIEREKRRNAREI